VKGAELPIVEVTWIDACTDVSHEADLADKQAMKDFGGLVLCKDVGYLVRKNRHEVVLAVSQFVDEDSVRHSNSIPARWIKSIVYLTATEAPAKGSPSAAKAAPQDSK